MKQTTPTAIDDVILQFCKDDLQSEEQPFYLTLTPDPIAVRQQCHLSVINKIHNDGGDIKFGWIIWYARTHFIEGEFHAVWVSPEGTVVDITPKADRETRILFCPSKTVTWQGKLVENIRRAFSDDGKTMVRRGESQTRDKRAKYKEIQSYSYYLNNKEEAAKELKDARKVTLLMHGFQSNEPKLTPKEKAERRKKRK